MPRAKNPQGAKIRKRREELGYTQQQLATLADMERTDLSNIELDKAGVGPERGPRLALALRWPLHELGLTHEDLNGHSDEQLTQMHSEIREANRRLEALTRELGELRELLGRQARGR